MKVYREPKRIAGVYAQARHGAVFEMYTLQAGAGNIAQAQVAGFKGAVYKPAARNAGKCAAGKSTLVIFGLFQCGMRVIAFVELVLEDGFHIAPTKVVQMALLYLHQQNYPCHTYNFMKTHTTNYANTLILIADDSPVAAAVVPLVKDKKTVANLQYELLIENPYRYTSDDVLFMVHAQRADIGRADVEEARKVFFSKGQACFRASPLTKRYGWGIYADADGKIALIACHTNEYRALMADDTVQKVKAMKSAR